VRTREDVIDDLLVLAVQAGDLGAFERFATRWHPRLFRHARRLTGGVEGARDVTQEAWVAIVRGLGRRQDPAMFAPWALQITGRRCADWIARQRRARRGRPRRGGARRARWTRRLGVAGCGLRQT
jgi:RNA polymerase sigma-70 factor (ECF subfamily)